MIVIMSFDAGFAYGWNRDHLTVRVAQAVIAHRTGDKPADADMLLSADDEQRRALPKGRLKRSSLHHRRE